MYRYCRPLLLTSAQDWYDNLLAFCSGMCCCVCAAECFIIASLFLPPEIQGHSSFCGCPRTRVPSGCLPRRRIQAEAVSHVYSSCWYQAGVPSLAYYRKFDFQWNSLDVCFVYGNVHVESPGRICRPIVIVTLEVFLVNEIFDGRLSVMDFHRGRNYL